MQVDSLQFGSIDVDPDKILDFPRGLLGFEGFRRYVLVEKEDCQPFMWLQSVETPDLALVVVNPKVFYPDYRVTLHAREVADIKVTDPDQVEILVIATIPPALERMSLNLQGPLLVNRENNLAKQIVLTDSDYSVQHFVYPELARKAGVPDSKAPAGVP